MLVSVLYGKAVPDENHLRCTNEEKELAVSVT
jgi:hypothetical protein